MESFKCVVCDTIGNWENVDRFRFAAKGMSLCKTCGFVTYPDICAKPEAVTDHYRGHEYREAPTVNNLYAGERKLHYHGAFLQEWLDEARKLDAGPRVLEIGAAQGMVLGWIKSMVAKAELYGTELTLSFRRNAWHMYQVRLDEFPDFSRKYDLIISYKVAEHIPNIDAELRKYAEALADGGKLYISVPTWFSELSNFGMSGFDLEAYYDPNHVNVWSRNLFEQVLKKTGLRIVKENHTYYGNTYLCVRDDSVMEEPLIWDDIDKRLQELDRVLQVAKLAAQGQFAQAIEIWPNYPEGHVNAYEMQRSKVHKEGFEEIRAKHLQKALDACPQSAMVANFCADVCMRYEKFQDAIGLLNRSLELKPNDPAALTALHQCFRHMSLRQPSEADKMKLRLEAREVCRFIEKVSKQCGPEAITWMMQDNAVIPTPFEGEAKIVNMPVGRSETLSMSAP
jgi:SAM-dependent methyltransferase